MTLCPSVYSDLCANVERSRASPARARLFYGMYDYPVIDYYFETICRVGTSRLREDLFLETEYFPWWKANIASLVSRVSCRVSDIAFSNLRNIFQVLFF